MMTNFRNTFKAYFLLYLLNLNSLPLALYRLYTPSSSSKNYFVILCAPPPPTAVLCVPAFSKGSSQQIMVE